MIIFADREQTIKQTDKQTVQTLSHSNPLWIVGGAGQYKVLFIILLTSKSILHLLAMRSQPISYPSNS